MGVPHDGGVTNRPGARFGPRAVRDASALQRRFHPTTRINPYDLCQVADVSTPTHRVRRLYYPPPPHTHPTYTRARAHTRTQVGDVNLQVVLQDQLPKINKNIEQSFRELRESDCVTLAVGGDHSVSYPIIRGLLLNDADDEELDLSSDEARAEFEARWYPPGEGRTSGGDAQQVPVTSCFLY